MFQFTPARGGRPRGVRTVVAGGRFNSRPRVAGDRKHYVIGIAPQLVSIHARAWRATFAHVSAVDPVFVSIHARAWRATARGQR